MQLLDQPTTKSPRKGNVKMPKLVIIEYDGTYDKWLSFWNNALPVISRCQPNLQSLQVNFLVFSFMVCGLLDNLPGIRADHMNGKPGWQDQGLAELMQSLEEWKAIHPIKVNESVHRISPSLLPSCILTLHICHILLVFLTKVVSTCKIMDQSTHMFTVIV